MRETSNFLGACRGEAVETVPVWFMRQAGRCLPEYRLIRERHTLLEICDEPELAAEVTLQPVRRLGVDAAILFSDIVIPLRGVGIDLDIKEGVGPVIFDPIASPADAAAMRTLAPESDIPQVLETVRILAQELEVPLIGFAGAPFTLACYLIDGGPSKDHARAKAFMLREPEGWRALMDTLTTSTIAYLDAADNCGRLGDPTFRLVGGVAGPRGLPNVREAVGDAHLQCVGRGRGPSDQLRGEHGRAVGRHGRCGMRRAWRGSSGRARSREVSRR